MKQQHNIESAFVIVLFAVFAVTIMAVLALGANSYQKLVKRDTESYNKRIITSYVTAKIHNHDINGDVAVGGFAKVDEEDGVDTLHLYETINGEKYDVRIYYYDGYIRELFTIAGLDIKPEAGSRITEAGGLSLRQDGSIIQITATDTDGLQNTSTVAIRSSKERH